MSPFGAFFTALFSIMAFVLPRGGALIGVLGGVCYVTQYEMVDIGGFHMHAIRVVCLVALVRTAVRGELAAMRYNLTDKIFVIYTLVSAVIFIVREHSIGAFVNQLGFVYNLLVPYFALRALITSYEDFVGFLSKAAFFIVPVAILMSLEAQTGRSLFSGSYDEFRAGHFRCQGPFRIPITGGTFGSTLVPLFVGLWFVPGRRLSAIVGICAATNIVICSRSSGPLLAFMAGFLGLFFWFVRGHMSAIRRGLVVTLIALHLYMKAPVWFLMSHIGDIVGGGGWHRAEIVDAAIKHFGSWWLLGTSATGDWVGIELAIGGADLTNQFVAEGVHAGLVSLWLFIWIIVRCFSAVGLAVDKVIEESPGTAKMLWAMGAALFGTVVNFFSISYFDQIQVVWLLLLAAIVSVTSAIAAQEAAVTLGEESQALEESQLA